MRWVKITISSLIVLLIIPSIVKIINDLSGHEAYEDEYEIIITHDNINESFKDFLDHVVLSKTGEVDNSTGFIEVDGYICTVDYYDFAFYNDDGYFNIYTVCPDENLDINLPIENPTLPSIINDYLKITLLINVEAKDPLVSPIILTLISLIPLIITTGLITYQYKNLKYKKIRKDVK